MLTFMGRGSAIVAGSARRLQYCFRRQLSSGKQFLAVFGGILLSYAERPKSLRLVTTQKGNR